ncbi:FKBP-type peptidyl-prolyl cis-trans isomerase [Pseudomarimonas arenosa]|uniref:Peptidyl-prolyl cis-trans isomerase n=1 Tax=Pseudomarimonas arenosa TaxID=2774145 RepID=A0AAW3ZED6_9GAMM|nr:FKBP-type peptidyl-prolyl cis-trans isomerase [Pseudomarimonas arenosa]MBD8524548.1 FKBP-type peptidyl-prolyl cis-trans isomerase [Pseudomarimonas arenosa]
MNSLFRPTLLAAAVAGVLISSSVFAQPKLESEKDKISYVIGTQIGGSIVPIKEEVDLAIVIEAIKASVDGKEPALTPEQAMEVQKAFAQKMQAKQAAKMQEMATKNKAEGEAFMAKNKSEAGVKSTESGLQYRVVTQGSGAKPAATDTVKVHYVGTLLDGTKFDSSVDRGQPAQFALNAVIPGWTEALQLMPVGSKYTLWIPSELGYGDRGTPGPIGPNATLKFEVELLEIVKQ